MNTEQLNQMKTKQGFVAALDQSGGSTPKALAAYGITEDSYSNEAEMYDLVHQMRTRIITSPAFTNERIIATILFKQTMRSQIEGKDTADYLWKEKGIVPILKIDEGLADLADGVQLMKPMTELADLLVEAKQKNIFGTKMRSVIKEHSESGIRKVVEQQFEVARQICEAGLVPIIEPEVDIHAADKSAIEDTLLAALSEHLDTLDDTQPVMLKLSIPEKNDLYRELTSHPNVVRVVALSGGLERSAANERLTLNHGVIASFSRALAEGLYADQTDEEFNQILENTVSGIYQASIT